MSKSTGIIAEELKSDKIYKPKGTKKPSIICGFFKPWVPAAKGD
jgi:hypothetical protein